MLKEQEALLLDSVYLTPYRTRAPQGPGFLLPNNEALMLNLTIVRHTYANTKQGSEQPKAFTLGAVRISNDAPPLAGKMPPDFTKSFRGIVQNPAHPLAGFFITRKREDMSY